MIEYRGLFIAVVLAFTSAIAFAQSGRSVVIENPFARPSAGPAGASAAYMTIRNRGRADRLIAVSTPDARAAELHTHIRDGDVMRMRKIESVEIPADSAFVLEPGGFHVMLIGPDKAFKAGDTFVLTLTFEKAGSINVDVPVWEMGAGRTHTGHQPGAPKQHRMPKH